MQANNFYPQLGVFDCVTNNIIYTENVQNQSDYGTNGMSAYYIGYLNSSDLPSNYNICSYAIEGYGISIEQLEQTVNPDFLYAWLGSYYNNIEFKSEYKSETKFSSDSVNVHMLNSLSPLNVGFYGSGRVLSFVTKLIERRWADNDPTNISFNTTNDSTTFTSADAVIKWLNGTTTARFLALYNGSTLDLDLYASDIEDGVYSETRSESGYTSEFFVFITGIEYQRGYLLQNDGVNTANQITQSCFGFVHVICGDREFLMCNTLLHSPEFELYYDGTNLTIRNGTYNNTVVGLTSCIFDLSSSEYGQLYEDNNTYVYRENINNYYIMFSPLSVKSLKFMLALNPSLNGTYSDDIFLPLIEDNRLTGEFFNYEDINDYGTEWQQSNEISDNEYSESDKPVIHGENIWENGNEVTGNSYTSSSNIYGSSESFCTYYNLSSFDLNNLATVLSQSQNSFWEAIGTSTDYKQQNILDYIVSLRYYPFPINAIRLATKLQFGYNANAVIDLGISSGNPSYYLTQSAIIINLGTLAIPTKNGKYYIDDRTFLDFEPYTTCKIYLPFFGIAVLKSEDVIGRDLELKLALDLVTGIGTYYLDSTGSLVAGKHILTVTCKIGCDMSVSGNDIVMQSEKMSSAFLGAIDTGVKRVNSIINTVSSIGENSELISNSGFSSSLVKDTVNGVLSEAYHTAMDVERESMNIASSRKAVPELVTQGSGFGNTGYNVKPRVIVERPALVIPATYGHETGHPLNQSRTLGTMSGYVICDNPDLSGINALEDEKIMIYRALCSGIYL